MTATDPVTRDPIATLRGVIADCQDVLSLPDVDRALAALAQVEQLVEAARDACGWLVEYEMSIGNFEPRPSSALDAALLPFGQPGDSA